MPPTTENDPFQNVNMPKFRNLGYNSELTEKPCWEFLKGERGEAGERKKDR
jgi:hypothetical protein